MEVIEITMHTDRDGKVSYTCDHFPERCRIDCMLMEYITGGMSPVAFAHKDKLLITCANGKAVYCLQEEQERDSYIGTLLYAC